MDYFSVSADNMMEEQKGQSGTCSNLVSELCTFYLFYIIGLSMLSNYPARACASKGLCDYPARACASRGFVISSPLS